MRQAGFTLIEVIVAFVVLQVAIAGALGTLARATELLRRAEQIEAAITVSQGVLDSLLWSESIDVDGRRSFRNIEVEWSISGPSVVVTGVVPTGERIRLSGWRRR